MKIFLPFIVAILAYLGIFPAVVYADPGFRFEGGYYTNLCGGQASLDGTDVDAYRCDAECNPNTGVCRAAERSTNPPETRFAYVIKYICTGKTTNCDNTNAAGRVIYENYSTEHVIHRDPTPSCNQTSQLDVFDSNNNLKGFMTWYAGDCVVPTPTTVPPTPTQIPTETPTPTPVRVTPTPTPVRVTPTPTRTPTPVPTVPPQGGNEVSCPEGFEGVLSDSTIICLQQNQNQNQQQWVNSSSNASTGPINVSLSSNESRVVEVPKVVKVAGVSKELPKTGIPLAAWALSGFLPIGVGLKRFGGSKKAQETANFIWQQREFLK